MRTFDPAEEISREEALWEWVSRPPLHGESFLFGFLRGTEGSCTIIPVNDRVVKRYVNGTSIREYAFALQIMLSMSNADDNTNIENMILTRTWQKWIARQGKDGNFPNFGEKCSDYRLLVGDEAPRLAHMRSSNDNRRARYDFFATIIYREEF